MRKKAYLLSMLFYLVGAFSFFTYLFIYFSSTRLLNIKGHVLLILLVYICVCIAGYILYKYSAISKTNVSKITCSVLILFVIIYSILGRDGNVELNYNVGYAIDSIINRRINIIPFATIYSYMEALFSQSMNRSIVVINLFGQVVAMMPLAILLPVVSNKFTKWSYCLSATVVISIFVEVMQLIFMTGFCDIDDIILNTIGVSIVFGMFKLKPLNHLIDLLVDRQVNV